MTRWDVVVCTYGHCTPVDDHHMNAAWEFDYTRQCRRQVRTRMVPDADGKIGDFDEIEGGEAFQYVRCKRPVVPLAQRSELHSAFLIGGEEAVIHMLAQEEETHGQAFKNEGA